MKPFIALPFTELTVQVVEEYDPTCLLKIFGAPMRVVGRKSITRHNVSFRNEEGWKNTTPQAIPVIEVEAKE